MGKWISLLFILLLVFAYSINAADWRVGMEVGHYGGLGWDAYGSVHHFAQGLPLAA